MTSEDEVMEFLAANPGSLARVVARMPHEIAVAMGQEPAAYSQIIAADAKSIANAFVSEPAVLVAVMNRNVDVVAAYARPTEPAM